MEHIWSPWRYKYIASAAHENGCVFCRVQNSKKDRAESDRENFIIHRAKLNYIILNLFPYTSGHLMIVPYEHTAWLAGGGEATTKKMMELAKQAQKALEAEYHPDGFNIGMNLGQSAGAGVADHLHLHVVPRWTGDANFVSIIGETRVLPEDLATTYKKLKNRLQVIEKDLEPNAWDRFFETHKLGDVVKGKVVRFANFGAFVEIEEGIEGLCHVSELSDERVEKPEDAVKIGQVLPFKILKLDPAQKKIGLSARAVD